MPKPYEAMRDKFAEGAPKDSKKYDAAQSKAAAIYNSKHKKNPVTGKHGPKRRGRPVLSSKEAADSLQEERAEKKAGTDSAMEDRMEKRMGR
jgi:hypothetical protein